MGAPTIIWELSLACNLNCSFCNQQSRRQKNPYVTTIERARAIISHLPFGSHVSFLWGETFMFPGFETVLQLLQDKNISCEITTNGTLLWKNVELITRSKNIVKLTVSLDGYRDAHDVSRWSPGLFKKILTALPHISKKIPITVSTVITTQAPENLLQLHHTLPRVGVSEHRLIYCLQYSSEIITETRTYIPEIQTSAPGNLNINEYAYQKRFISYVSLLRKHKHPDIRLFCEPDLTIITDSVENNSYCKQIDEQFRIDESGRLSICGNMLNHFADLTKTDFQTAIAQPEYLAFIDRIKRSFPLPMCETCCKRNPRTT